MDAKLAEMAQQNLAGLQFVRDGLALQKRYSLRVPVPQQLFQLPDVAVFTAQSQHQYTACIGMADQITQDTTGMLLIVSRLGTAIGMGPSVDTRHAASDIAGDYPCQRFSHAVDTAHGGDDPDLIADAHTSLAAKALKGAGGRGH